jgi:hypothetical protein
MDFNDVDISGATNAMHLPIFVNHVMKVPIKFVSKEQALVYQVVL